VFLVPLKELLLIYKSSIISVFSHLCKINTLDCIMLPRIFMEGEYSPSMTTPTLIM
jgi:hypothetical protein